MTFAFGILGPGPTQYALLVAGALLMTACIGPSGAVVTDVAHPAIRATAVSVLSLTQNLLGLAVGPVLTGFLSDMYGLAFAMAVVPAIGVPAGCVFLLAARHYAADKARARDALAHHSSLPCDAR
jgi:MFS family permease